MAKTTKAAKPGALMAQVGNMKLAGPAKPGTLMMAHAGNMKLAGPVKPEKPAKKTSAKKKA